MPKYIVVTIVSQVAFMLVCLFVSPDFGAAGQWGVSIGTNSAYCSIDYPAGISCQSGS